MVMFRDFVQRKASGLKLTGEVQNLPDGTVRVVAEGERAKLEALVEKLQHGPLLANVSGVQSSFHPADGSFKSFSIRYE